MYLFFSYNLLFILLSGLLVMNTAIADDGENSGSGFSNGRQLHYRSDRDLGLEKLFDESEIEAYRNALSDGECDPAYALLANAYSEYYPNEPHPGSGNTPRRNWEIYVVHDHYPGLALCLELRDLAELRAKLVRDGIQMEPLSQSDLAAPQNNDTIRFIINRIHILGGLAQNGYAPAAMAMLRLSEEGEVIRFTSAFRFYVAKRLQERGIDTEEIANITARAAARLGAEAIAELTHQAEDGHFTYSSEWLE